MQMTNFYIQTFIFYCVPVWRLLWDTITAMTTEAMTTATRTTTATAIPMITATALPMPTTRITHMTTMVESRRRYCYCWFR